MTGLLDLDTPASEVLHNLRAVARSETVLQVRLAGDREDGEGNCDLARPSGRGVPTLRLFTANTAALLTLVSQGLSDGEIGEQLHLSPHTVKHLIERLRDEVGARNCVALAAWAGRHGFDRPIPALLPSSRPEVTRGKADPGLSRAGAVGVLS